MKFGLEVTGSGLTFGPNAGRRTDFSDKKSSDFSGEIFRERNFYPRTAFWAKNVARF